MCGIVGVLDTQSNRSIDRDMLLRMRDSMLSRGPDEAGTFFKPGIAFGHRRLSIIDLSGGQQPLSIHSGDITITYNGEVYNYKELRSELIELGHSFNTVSDTEVVVSAWKEWGSACVERFRGMFAFAIWDRRSSTLFLARDRLGIKPLVYAQTTDGYFVFSSEIKSLLECPTVSTDLLDRSVENYFAYGYVPEPDSIYKAIQKLEAGHTLSVVNGRMGTPKRYWDVPLDRTTPSMRIEEAKEQLVERLLDAVKVRLIADVPLGAFLSGGVDSSAVVAMMSQLQSEPVHTCSIGFDSAQYDESTYAQQVANLYDTDHHSRVVHDDDHDQIEKIAAIYDEPYADSSALPTLRVCEMARESVKVALSGDGADELMLGYRRQNWHLKEEKIRQYLAMPLRQVVFGPLGKYYPKADWAPQLFRAKTTFQALSQSSVSAYMNTVSVISEETRRQLLSKEFRNGLAGYTACEVFSRHAKNANTDDPALLIQYLDMKTYLVDDILTKVDRASMAQSLEVRVPFLDHHLVEWLMTVPSTHKLHNGVGKAMLKAAMKDFLPHDVLYRKKKGFSVPLADWMRGPLKERVASMMNSERLGDSGFIDMDYLSRMCSDHQRGARDNSTAIWSVLMFDSFLRGR